MESVLDENKHVHQVYESIAGHFSNTRYKGWPVVDEFLKSMEMGSLVADIGCGNGKYLNLRKENEICMIGCDRCEGLVKIAYNKNPKSFIGDALFLPWRNNLFDYCLSIAVIHHLSTEERRVKSLLEMTRVLRLNGVGLVFVWAFEQKNKRFEFQNQDVMVPWHLQKNFNKESQNEVVYQRYYHVFKSGELESLVEKANQRNTEFHLQVIESGYDKDNWYIKVKKHLKS